MQNTPHEALVKLAAIDHHGLAAFQAAGDHDLAGDLTPAQGDEAGHGEGQVVRAGAQPGALADVGLERDVVRRVLGVAADRQRADDVPLDEAERSAEQGDASGERVAWVNEAFVRRFLSQQDPLQARVERFQQTMKKWLRANPAKATEVMQRNDRYVFFQELKGDGPIGAMEHEHDDAGQALARLRELTGGYVPPADACNTFRGLYHGLEEFEAALHQHIHLENNVLFPRTARLERELAA